MPKIIVTSCYIKPNAHKKFGNYIKHIVTRERAILRTILAMRARNPRTKKLRILMKIRLRPKIKECQWEYKEMHYVEIRTVKIGFRRNW